VGAPIVDVLKKEKLPVKLHPVTITAGNAFTQEGSHFHVPKRDLATAVKILLDSRRLKISTALSQHALLTRELEDFRVKINTKTANDSYEAWREGQHDDLVLATAMACWYAERRRAKILMGSKKAARPTSAPGVEIRKINDVHEEIILHSPTDEERRKAQEGWRWQDIKFGGRV
jgi:hypothetical protein